MHFVHNRGYIHYPLTPNTFDVLHFQFYDFVLTRKHDSPVSDHIELWVVKARHLPVSKSEFWQSFSSEYPSAEIYETENHTRVRISDAFDRIKFKFRLEN